MMNTVITAYTDCPECLGSGMVYNTVPYGDTYVKKSLVCDTCISRAIAEGTISVEEADFVEVQSNPDWPFDCDEDQLPGRIGR